MSNYKKISVGNYYFIVGENDTYDSEALEKAHDYAVSGDYDMLCLGSDVSFLQKSKVEQIKYGIFAFGNSNIKTVWNKFVKKDIYNKVLFGEESEGEDCFVSCQFLYYSNKIGYFPKTLYSRNKPFKENFLDRKRNFERIIEFCKEKFGDDLSVFEPELTLRMWDIKWRVRTEKLKVQIADIQTLKNGLLKEFEESEKFLAGISTEHWEAMSKVVLDGANKILNRFPPLPSASELKMVKSSYDCKLESLRKQEKINVVFLVWQNSRWNADSFYKKLASDLRFSPIIIVVSPSEHFEENPDYLFFQKRNYNVFAITNTNYNGLVSHKPDIVFYQMPWLVNQVYNELSPFNVSRCALCIYLPYAIGAIANLKNTWAMGESFFRLVYKHFCFSSDCVREYEACGLSNVVATGSAKLDVYAEPIKNNPWRNSDKIKIIYAPHHSFEGHWFSWATFAWNGREILQLAKNNLHTEWIFKPHPSFKERVVKFGVFTEKELDEYLQEWEKIGQIYEKGDYFDIFRTSDLMITDCNSFLTEYLPTGNPVIYPVSSGETIDERPTVIKRHSQHYYKVYNVEELESAFDMLVNRKEDPLKAERQKDAAEITFDSGEKMYNELLKMLET